MMHRRRAKSIDSGRPQALPFANSWMSAVSKRNESSVGKIKKPQSKRRSSRGTKRSSRSSSRLKQTMPKVPKAASIAGILKSMPGPVGKTGASKTTKRNSGRKSGRKSIGAALSSNSASGFDLAVKGLVKVTRFVHEDDAFPFIKPKLVTIMKRVDGEKRLSTPFEHVCGGNQDFDREKGNDGPSNFLSFSNANFAEVDADCGLFYDKGQMRVKIDVAKSQAARFIDLSDKSKAFAWCYRGGNITTPQGNVISFKGVKDLKPWPYLCAKSVFQHQVKKKYPPPIPDDWWSPLNRMRVAEKCASWAMMSREVLVLPDPDKVLQNDTHNGIKVEVDRKKGKNICKSYPSTDKCVSFDRDSGKVCCCSDPSCSSEPCPVKAR